MAKIFDVMFLGLGVLWCAGALAQPQPVAGPDGSLEQFVPGLDVILREPSEAPGVMVAGVFDRAPAAAAGLLPGDVVLRVGEHAIASIADVFDALPSVAPGSGIEIVVRRGDEEQTLHSASLSSLPASVREALLALCAPCEFADYDALWNPTHVPNGRPQRHLAKIVETARGWLIQYDHGGLGPHTHTVEFELEPRIHIGPDSSCVPTPQAQCEW